MQRGSDAERVKEAIDLHTLAARYTRLKHWARREEAGPCPLCGGKDRFHVYDDGLAGAGQWWMCYRCHPRPGDAIEFVRWLEHCDFATALGRLAAQAGMEPQVASPSRLPARTRVHVSPAPLGSAVTSAQPSLPFPEPTHDLKDRSRPATSPTSTPNDPGWQERAQREISAAVHRLWQPEGEPGRRYLAERGFYPLTLHAWGLGFVHAWHPRRGERWPAIAIPWREDGKIMAVQYRFIPALPRPTGAKDPKGPDLGHGERFSQKPGGVRRAFGLEMLAAHHAVAEENRPAPALILVEGEFNALAIWQVLHDPGPWVVPATFRAGPVDVLSFGSESGATARALPGLAAAYGQAVVWADRAERASEGAALLRGGGVTAAAVSSPDGRDANDLLRAGRLAGFLAELLGCEPLDPR